MLELSRGANGPQGLPTVGDVRGLKLGRPIPAPESASGSPPINIDTVVDGDDLHKVFAFVDSIDDTVSATSGAPETFELQTKWLAHPVRRVGDVIDRLQDS